MTILSIVISYLLGSVSSAYLLVKATRGIDIRTIGSGNAGATNVHRVLGTGPALLVFLMDVLKGVIAVLIGRALGGQTLSLLCGIAVVGGHIWPLFFGLRGGKGTATSLGVVWTLIPDIALIVTTVGITAVAVTRYVSLGTILAAPLLFILVILSGRSWHYIIFAFILMCMTLFKHRENIIRIMEGRESKLGERIKRVR